MAVEWWTTLEAFDFWCVKVHNSNGVRRHECTIKHGGRRVSASAFRVHDSVSHACETLTQKRRGKLKLARAT